jgi:hypothetical protein
MNASSMQIAVLLAEARTVLFEAAELVRPETEHLLDELERIVNQIDILAEKVEEEGRILRDKEVLVGESRPPLSELPRRSPL